MSKRAVSEKELSQQLGVHHKMAWHWCHRLRTCVAVSFGKQPLTGALEVDVTHIGGTDDGAHGGRSPAGHKALVAGAVELPHEKMGRARIEAR